MNIRVIQRISLLERHLDLRDKTRAAASPHEIKEFELEFRLWSFLTMGNPGDKYPCPERCRLLALHSAIYVLGHTANPRHPPSTTPVFHFPFSFRSGFRYASPCLDSISEFKARSFPVQLQPEVAAEFTDAPILSGHNVMRIVKSAIVRSRSSIW